MAKVVASVAAISCLWQRVSAAPSCDVVGEYQNQPVVFDCYGSNEANDNTVNSFQFLVAGGSERELFNIPDGTEGLDISLNLPVGNTAYFVVYDETKKANIFDKDVAGVTNRFNTTFLKTSIVWSLDGTSQSLSLTGPTPGPLQLRFQNTGANERVYQFTYKYNRYNQGPRPMCEPHAGATGCQEYIQASARVLGEQWSTWIRGAFPNTTSAWDALADPSTGNIPYYRWCQTYSKWPGAKATDCWRVYKFLSHGGLEDQVTSITRTQFNIIYNLIWTNDFAVRCCNLLVGTYADANAAWTAFGSTDAKGQLWGKCMGLENAPADKTDYLSYYLDADGSGELVAADIAYCWNAPPRPPEKECKWTPATGCVGSFTYKGASYTGCTTKDHAWGWCSTTAESDGTFHHCISECKEKGASAGCVWTKNAICAANFTYKGKSYTGCSRQDHNNGWCSVDQVYDGNWAYCTWTCPANPTESPATSAANAATSANALSTTMTAPAKKGDTTIQIASSAGFSIGMAIKIGADTDPNQMVNSIASFGSMVLTQALTSNFPANTPITELVGDNLGLETWQIAAIVAGILCCLCCCCIIICAIAYHLSYGQNKMNSQVMPQPNFGGQVGFPPGERHPLIGR